MIQLTDKVWIGNAEAACGHNLYALNITAVLNVAHDLCGQIGWPHMEYMQVGLIDGPGNPLNAYYAAVLALDTLLKRHEQVVVCCHGGSRSLAVVIMHINAMAKHLYTLDGLLNMILERVDIGLPLLHEAHRTAFNTMHWGAFYTLRNE